MKHFTSKRKNGRIYAENCLQHLFTIVGLHERFLMKLDDIEHCNIRWNRKSMVKVNICTEFCFASKGKNVKPNICLLFEFLQPRYFRLIY